MRRERWPTREERQRLREQIAEAGGAVAWIRASKPSAEDVHRRLARLNALAEKCGMPPPYPSLDKHGRPEAER